MADFDSRHSSLLALHNRAIVHMRKQILANRFGLVFGSGISKKLGVPNWEELVLELAADKDIQGENVLKLVPPRIGSPYQTEMLFEHYRRKQYARASNEEHHTRKLDFRIGADWREKVRNLLYSKISKPMRELLNQHPYLSQYLPLVQRSHMTVTYNFDDFLEQALLLRAQEMGKTTSRGFESVTNTWTQFRRPTGTIYHPNGVVPQNALETPSDRFVFSEASFAAQLMGIFAGDQTGLLNHLSKHTCLLIGLSLEDETLRSALMRAARECPGNYHYYVHYLNPKDAIDEEKRHAVTYTNFKVYNLITLFLDDDGLRALGELIDVESCCCDQFCDFAKIHRIPVRFRFYITGPMGVGKSTLVNHFRNLIVLDEWLEQRPSILAKGFSTLTPAEKEDADKWIVGQFALKNGSLRNEKEGIFLLDRGPIDPVAFTANEEWKVKAARLLQALCPGAVWDVEDGLVILLKGDFEELGLRMLISQRKDYKPEDLKKMAADLAKAYGTNGVLEIDTKGLTSADVARRLGEIIHLEKYENLCNLHKRLQQLEQDGINAP